MHGPISTNGILAVLGADGLGLLKPHLTGITLDKHHRLADAGQPMARAYFPTSGIASVVTGIRNDAPIEVGLIGREGFVGAPIAMGVGSTPSETYMQVAGHGWHIAAGPLSEAVEASASLRAVLLRFAQVFMVQMASTVLANGHATCRSVWRAGS